MAPKPKEKSKSSSATPQLPPPPIEHLFTSLNKHIQRSEFEQAVKVADQVLSISALDEDAIRCKIVALIKDDKIDEALSAIKAFSRATLDFSFFKAYCLYRQKKLDEALETLKDVACFRFLQPLFFAQISQFLTTDLFVVNDSDP